jgi:hypothetical protein
VAADQEKRVWLHPFVVEEEVAREALVPYTCYQQMRSIALYRIQSEQVAPVVPPYPQTHQQGSLEQREREPYLDFYKSVAAALAQDREQRSATRRAERDQHSENLMEPMAAWETMSQVVLVALRCTPAQAEVVAVV